MKPPEPRSFGSFPLSRFFNSTLTLSPSHTTREGPGRAPLKTRTGLVGPPSAILSGVSVKSCSSVSLKTQVLGSFNGSLHPVPHFSPRTSLRLPVSIGPGSPSVKFVNDSQALCMYGYIHFCLFIEKLYICTSPPESNQIAIAMPAMETRRRIPPTISNPRRLRKWIKKGNMTIMKRQSKTEDTETNNRKVKSCDIQYKYIYN